MEKNARFTHIGAYGALALPMAMLLGPVYAFLPTFFVQSMGLSQAGVGLALLVARLWDGVSDPLVGYFSDRTRSIYGRRKIWMLAGLPFMLCGITALFLMPQSISTLSLGLWSAVLFTGWTMVKLSHDALGAELSPDSHFRLKIAGVREGFGLAGTLLAIIILGIGLSGDISQALKALGLGLIGAVTFCILLILYRIKEPATPSHAISKAGQFQAFAEILKNQKFKRLCTAFLLNGFAAALPTTLFLLFVEFRLDAPDWRGPLIILYFICGCAAIPLWVHLSRRFGQVQVWRFAMAFSALCFLPVLFLRPGDEIYFALICVCTGIGLGADLALPAAITADLVDDHWQDQGTRRTGLMFAALAMVMKLAFALAVGLAFPILEGLEFNQTPGSMNSEQALMGLAALYGLLPAIAKAAAVIVLAKFSIRREAYI